ncbi:MAG: hypothetical protein ABSA47_16285 [Verrucomicrobiota bacterium]|jgi:hypothetical protein
MNKNKILLKAGNAGIVLGAALLMTLTGCVGYVDGPRARVYVAPAPVYVGPGPVYVAPPPVAVTFAVQDDYVYYPGYDVYYSSNLRQYLWLQGGAWVSGPGPRGVSANVVLASPSVRMDFHDSPALHHAAIVRQYPKNWRPAAAAPERRDEERGGR